MSLIHIYRATGPYIGQLRWRGYQKWRTVTKRHKTMSAAACEAIRKMGHEDKRIRVLMLDEWNEPIVCFEGDK